jgi:hypothetical protein
MKSLAIFLCILLGSPALPAQTLPIELNIVVVEGEGATNAVRQRVKSEPLIRVEDENHKPVSGAAVVFTLPTSGATGEFGNGSKTLTNTTDRNGMAAAQGLKMNYVAGKVPIHINASYRGLTARASIMQSSVLPPGAKQSKGDGHGGLIAVLIILGAAAGGGGAYVATRQKQSAGAAPTTPAGPPPIGITPGTGSITGGH